MIGEDPNGIPNNLMPFVAQVATGKRNELKVYGNDYDTHDGTGEAVLALCKMTCSLYFYEMSNVLSYNFLTGVRDYIHIVDLAEGHISGMKKVMDNNFSGWRVYNLGTGSGFSVLELVHSFEAASGKNIPYSIVERRPGDIASSYADPARAQKELGWIAKRTLSDMCTFKIISF